MTQNLGILCKKEEGIIEGLFLSENDQQKLFIFHCYEQKKTYQTNCLKLSTYIIVKNAPPLLYVGYPEGEQFSS